MANIFFPLDYYFSKLKWTHCIYKHHCISLCGYIWMLKFMTALMS